MKLYRYLHAHPELSFQEKETAARLANEWEQAGAEVTRAIGGHGIVGILNNGEGPILMLRTDMDALPVTEATGLVYSSTAKATNKQGVEVGVMHACGHDVHMANLTGVCRFSGRKPRPLAGNRDACRPTRRGNVARGRRAMLRDGLFEKFPRPDFAIALHVDALLATGKVGYRTGYSLANVDSVDITVRGRGGHGAYPQTTVDPIVQAAELVLSLQTIVSREVKPIEPAVVTVGSIHGGTKHNVIGDTCKLQLTVRSYTDEVRSLIHDAIQRKATAVAHAYAAPEPDVQISEGTPSLWNDPELGKRLGQVFERVLGVDNVTTAEPSMGGEDFSRYGEAGVPILMFRLGAVNRKRLERFEQIGQPPPFVAFTRVLPGRRGDAENRHDRALPRSLRVAAAVKLSLLLQRRVKRAHAHLSFVRTTL